LNGLIPRLLADGSIDTLSKLILVNVAYFKGEWLYPFDAEKTAPMEFFVAEVKRFQITFWCH
jgi:serine protease inhibitor